MREIPAHTDITINKNVLPSKTQKKEIYDLSKTIEIKCVDH